MSGQRVRIAATMPDRGGEAVRAKSNLLNRFNLIWVVQLSLQKFTSSLSSPNQCFFRAVPPRQEGRIAVVTNARRDAVDARASAHKMPQGELNLMSGKRCAGWRRSMRTAKPCGPGTRGWCEAAGGEFDPTGSIEPSSRQRRRQDEFVSGESAA